MSSECFTRLCYIAVAGLGIMLQLVRSETCRGHAYDVAIPPARKRTTSSEAALSRVLDYHIDF